MNTACYVVWSFGLCSPQKGENGWHSNMFTPHPSLGSGLCPHRLESRYSGDVMLRMFIRLCAYSCTPQQRPGKDKDALRGKTLHVGCWHTGPCSSCTTPAVDISAMLGIACSRTTWELPASRRSKRAKPFYGLASLKFRILKGNPKKELQWRL